MDAIKTYLDNVFASFPRTERVLSLKREMLAGMEEKYYALKQEGKSEHEAVGSVIANFGSIDEIAVELGLEQQAPPPQNELYLSREEAGDYLTQTKKYGKWIGGGVWLILAGVAAMIIIGNLTGLNGERDIAGAAGIFVLFLAIAAAVGIFIMSGLRLNRFEHYEKNNLQLDAATRADMELQSNRFAARFAVHIIAGVTMIILAAGSLAFVQEIAAFGNENLPVSLFLLIVGFAVFLFITAGMPKSAYDILLGKGEYKDKVRNTQAERIIGTVASVYWPLVTAIYLLWSFIYSAWGISWLIWPIAGIIFGAISGGVSVSMTLKTDKKDVI